jgi:hypothetical protein
MRLIDRAVLTASCFVAVLGASATLAAAATVPFVSCPSDGQTGPQPAPRKPAKMPDVPAAAAGKLAYYSSAQLGVLAPRGWHCAGIYGSSGATLIVTPDIRTPTELLSSLSLTGSAVQLSLSYGSTSGRFAVAAVAARLFPSKKSFVDRVVAEGIEPQSSFPSGPFPSDVLTRRSATDVEFQTPPNAAGIGTSSHLAKSGRPIRGVAIMTANNDLLLLDARVSPDEADLVPAIVGAVRNAAATTR